MQVGQVNSNIPHGLGLNKIKDEIIEDAPEQEPQNSEPLSDETDSPKITENDDSAGVLRLLQEGHFKGVADVRLRINFHDELEALENAQMREVTDAQTGGLTESVDPQLKELVDSSQITQEQADEAIGTLTQSINQANENFLSGQIETKEALSLEIQSAFDEFLSFLTGIVNVPETITELQEQAIDTPEENSDDNTEAIVIEKPLPEETPAVSDSTEEIIEISSAELNPEQEPVLEEIPIEQPLETPQQDTQWADDMKAAFDTALNAFISSLGEVKILPELSQPKGNGAAYTKFLEIYNNL